MITERLRYRDSPLKAKLIQFLRSHPVLNSAVPIRTEHEYNMQAVAALEALGRNAKPLIPTLAEALDHMDYFTRGTAETWLGSLGSDGEAALPALIQTLKDKKNRMRFAAVITLASVGREETNLVLSPVGRMST